MPVVCDVPIEMDDGTILRADVFLPEEDGKYPVIITLGPYAKGLSFQVGYKGSWDLMVAAYLRLRKARQRSMPTGSWSIPNGGLRTAMCLRMDGRGSGRSPGKLDLLSPRETQDVYSCIEWAGTQSWSSGKVGIHGISYYAINQWVVAAMQPPHLTAICVWEGAADWYCDWSRHGGILSQFDDPWFHGQVASVQHGVGECGAKSLATGEFVAGPETLSPETLKQNRAVAHDEELKRPLDGQYCRERSLEPSKVVVSLLSVANWGGMGCHPRGNFEGYLAAASTQKWLSVHGRLSSEQT